MPADLEELIAKEGSTVAVELVAAGLLVEVDKRAEVVDTRDMVAANIPGEVVALVSAGERML